MSIYLLIVFLILLIVAVVFICLLLVIFSALTMAGIISTSFVYGIYKQSFERGFKLLVVLTSTVFFAVLVTVISVVLNKIMHWFTLKAAVAGGIILGGLSGLVAGLVFFKLLKIATTKLLAWMKTKGVTFGKNKGALDDIHKNGV